VNRIRVLVVDDSALMRRIVSDMLSEDERIDVCGIARNGQEALEAVERLLPDVITLDIEMPVKNGLEVLPELATTYPVIMLSSLTKEGADATLRALDAGAFDFIAKPSGSISLDIRRVAEQLRAMVLAAVESRMKRNDVIISNKQPMIRGGRLEPTPQAMTVKEPFQTMKRSPSNLTISKRVCALVAIGTSTGGPRALQTIIPLLPKDFPAAVLVVQHMAPGFPASLAARLNQLSNVCVQEAVDATEIQPGHVYLAPGGYHMVARQEDGHVYRIALHQEQPMRGHRPSVDVLFESVARLTGVKLCATLLTGMGADGADGMRLLKQAGATTIVQSEQTCIVFGMPKAAISRHCVDIIAPIQQIASDIMKAVGSHYLRWDAQ